MSVLLSHWSAVARPVIGMIHLPALPGAPRFSGDLDSIRTSAVRDAEALAEGGVHGLMLENFGDVPFFARAAPPIVIAHMTAIACEVRRRFAQLPLGINVLRNDGRAALAIAHASGASFVRVNVLCGARVTDQGIIEGIAAELLRDRSALGASHIKILADVDVKHSAPLAPRPLAEEIADTIERGLADAIIVSGPATGSPTQVSDLIEAKRGARKTPVFVGSGVDSATIAALRDHADGYIVGSSLKRDGLATNPVDVNRVRELLRAL